MNRDPNQFFSPTIRGRGAAGNPKNRFEHSEVGPLEEPTDGELEEEPGPGPKTRFLPDRSLSIITRNNSPDLGFDAGLNPYRGCEHGCSYCYARPYHEYLGMSAGIDFETKIMVKLDAPKLLRGELMKKSWEPQLLVMSGVTDCYQPIERKLEITRGCLKVLLEFRNPVGIITKNALSARDVDIFSEMAKDRLAGVNLSVTSLDDDLARRLEPRASTPRARLEAVATLAGAGVPVGVMVAPIIPGLNDHEIPAILKAAAEAGAQWAGFTILRLPYAVKDIFADWLERNEPGKKEKILNRVREVRGGKLNDSRFGARFRGEGRWAEEIKALFATAKRRAGLDKPRPELNTEAFRRPAHGQLELF